MRERLLHLVDWFIPESLRTSADVRRRAQLLVGLAFLISGLGPFFVAAAVAYGTPWIAWVTTTGTIVTFAIPFVLGATASMELATGLLVCTVTANVLLAVVSREGLGSPALPWLAMIPLIATALSGRRLGIVAAAVCAIAALALYALETAGVLVGQPLPALVHD